MELDDVKVQVEKLSPVDGDIVVVRFEDDVAPEVLMETFDGLQGMMPEGVAGIAVQGPTSVDVLSEMAVIAGDAMYEEQLQSTPLSRSGWQTLALAGLRRLYAGPKS